MARLPRLAVAGQLHLLIQRGHNGQAVFQDSTDYEAFCLQLRDAAHEHRVAVHAYSLLANEVVLLLTPGEAQALGRMVQALGRRFVRGYNLRHQRRGALWEGRFAATVVDAAQHGIHCLRFVDRQPADAGLVMQASDYPWSSAAHHTGVRADPLVTDLAAYWRLGNTPFEREAQFRQLLQEPLPAQERNLLRESTLKSWVLGDQRFQAVLADQTERRLQPMQRGRPRKSPVSVVE